MKKTEPGSTGDSPVPTGHRPGGSVRGRPASRRPERASRPCYPTND